MSKRALTYDGLVAAAKEAMKAGNIEGVEENIVQANVMFDKQNKGSQHKDCKELNNAVAKKHQRDGHFVLMKNGMFFGAFDTMGKLEEQLASKHSGDVKAGIEHDGYKILPPMAVKKGEAMQLIVKSHVKAHTRKTASGKIAQVKDYDTAKQKLKIDPEKIKPHIHGIEVSHEFGPTTPEKYSNVDDAHRYINSPVMKNKKVSVYYKVGSGDIGSGGFIRHFEAGRKDDVSIPHVHLDAVEKWSGEHPESKKVFDGVIAANQKYADSIPKSQKDLAERHMKGVHSGIKTAKAKAKQHLLEMENLTSETKKGEQMQDINQRVATLMKSESDLNTNERNRVLSQITMLASCGGTVKDWQKVLPLAKSFDIGVPYDMMKSSGLDAMQIAEALSVVDETVVDRAEKAFNAKHDDLEKAMQAGHRYWKREGSPGNYKYYYEHPEHGKVMSPQGEGGRHPKDIHPDFHSKLPDPPKSNTVAVRHTKSGHPITEAHQERQTLQAMEYANKAHDRTYPHYDSKYGSDSGSKMRRHMQAADAAAQWGWHAHHNGQEVDSYEAMSQAKYHDDEARGHAAKDAGLKSQYDKERGYHKRLTEAVELTGHHQHTDDDDKESNFHPDNHAKRSAKYLKKTEKSLFTSFESCGSLVGMTPALEFVSDTIEKADVDLSIHGDELASRLFVHLEKATAGHTRVRNALHDMGISKLVLAEMIAEHRAE